MTLPQITVSWPQPGEAIGSGYEVRWSYNREGPFAPGEYWRVMVRETPPGELVHFTVEYHNPTSQMADILHVYSDDTVWRPVPVPAFQPQTPVQFVVQLMSGQTIVDETIVDTIYDPIGGWPYQAWIASQASTPGQGFADADRQALLETKALAAFNLGAWLPELAAALQAAAQFPYGAELITPDRTGGGQLVRPGGGFNVNAFGLRYQVIDKPPGIGIDEGAPRSYAIPMVEIGLVGQVTGGDEVTLDSHWYADETGAWVWNLNIPFRVLYWIQPGVTVRFWWLLFNPLSGAALGPAQLLAGSRSSGSSQ